MELEIGASSGGSFALCKVKKSSVGVSGGVTSWCEASR